jgi:hypothetical protein
METNEQGHECKRRTTREVKGEREKGEGKGGKE